VTDSTRTRWRPSRAVSFCFILSHLIASSGLQTPLLVRSIFCTGRCAHNQLYGIAEEGSTGRDDVILMQNSRQPRMWWRHVDLRRQQRYAARPSHWPQYSHLLQGTVRGASPKKYARLKAVRFLSFKKTRQSPCWFSAKDESETGYRPIALNHAEKRWAWPNKHVQWTLQNWRVRGWSTKSTLVPKNDIWKIDHGRQITNTVRNTEAV